jgi:hypothetical protein
MHLNKLLSDKGCYTIQLLSYSDDRNALELRIHNGLLIVPIYPLIIDIVKFLFKDEIN